MQISAERQPCRLYLLSTATTTPPSTTETNKIPLFGKENSYLSSRLVVVKVRILVALEPKTASISGTTTLVHFRTGNLPSKLVA